MRTAKVCEPSPEVERLGRRDEEAAAVDLTSKVAVPSLSEKPKLTFLPHVEPPAGPESMLGTGGATASTVQVRVTAALVLPKVSTARTAKVWGPSARLEYAFGRVE